MNNYLYSLEYHCLMLFVLAGRVYVAHRIPMNSGLDDHLECFDIFCGRFPKMLLLHFGHLNEKIFKDLEKKCFAEPDNWQKYEFLEI
jgi:hypothetical protein